MHKEHFWKDDKNPHESVFSALASLDDKTRSRNETWRRFLSIFMNRGVSGLEPGARLSEEEIFAIALRGEKRLRINSIRNCIETLGARIVPQRPRPRFLVSTDGPDAWEHWQQARGLEKFVAGEWLRGKVYQQDARIFSCAGVLGFGAMKVSEHDKKLKFEWTPPWQLILEEAACQTRDPRTLYQQMWIPAEMLLAQFCSDKSGYTAQKRNANKAAIQRAVGDVNGDYIDGTMITTDLVKVVEAWHLPSGYGVDDGKHVICVEHATLTDKDEWTWKLDRFPFSFFKWDQPIFGWYPQGLVERQEPVQHQVNKMLGRIQDAAHLYSVANTYYEEGSIKKSHLKNTSGNMIPLKKGTQFKPQTDMPPSFNSQLLDFTWQLDSKIYHGEGVSEMSAKGVKPAGIEAAVAMRELKDTESGRHAPLNQFFDEYHVDLALLTIDMAKEVYGGSSYSTAYPHKSSVERIKWCDVDMERDRYIAQCFPSSQLPHEPAGRMATVEEMIKAGFVSQDEGKALLNMPDLEQFASLGNAAFEDIQWQIDQMLVHGKDIAPEEYQNLELGLSMVTSALLRSRQHGAPEERQRLLLDWIRAAQDLLAPPPPMPGDIPPEAIGEEMPPEMMSPEPMPPGPEMMPEAPPIPPGEMPPVMP